MSGLSSYVVNNTTLIIFAIVAALGLAATTTLFSYQVFADKPSNPNCVGEDFSFFAKTPRGAGDGTSELAHEEPRGVGDNVQAFRDAFC
jgi:hypothetical protein